MTPFEIGIILTANYTFLNYLVLSLGFLLLDDRFVEWILAAQGARPLSKRTTSVGAPGAKRLRRRAKNARQTWRAAWRAGCVRFG